MRADSSDVAEALRAASDAFSESVARSVTRTLSGPVGRIQSALRAGDVSAARMEAADLNADEAVRGARNRAVNLCRQSAIAGASLLDDPDTCLWCRGGTYPDEVDRYAPLGIIKAVESAFRSQVLPRVVKLVEGAEVADSEGRTLSLKAIDADELATQLNRFLRGEIKRVVNVSSNVTGTRVAAFGFLHEARVRGMARYRLDATLDKSTTTICRALDGRVYDVSTAYDRTSDVLRISDPKALKEQAPFPPSDIASQIESEDLSNEDLQARGFDVPPFHFLCRTVVTPIPGEEPPRPLWPDLDEWPSTAAQFDAQAEAAFPALRRESARALGLAADPDPLPDEDPFQSILRVEARRGGTKASAAARYGGNRFAEINSALRRGEDVPDELKPTVAALDELTDARAPRDLFVTRGFEKTAADLLEESGGTGTTFVDDAFVSTTMLGESPIPTLDTATIFVPEGSRGALFRDLSSYAGEEEFLLPRKSAFRVLDVTRKGRERHFKLEYVGIEEN